MESMVNITEKIDKINTLNNLHEFVTRWAYNKTEMDSYKDAVTDDANRIKQMMKELNLEELEVDGFKAVYSERVTSNFNEDKLLAKIKELGFDDCVKTVEVVDMEKLESLIYDNLIDTSSLLSCKETKVTPTLKLVKLK